MVGGLLAGRSLDEASAAERHAARALDHGDEVGEPRDVRGSRRAGAEHRRNLRDDTAHLHLLEEERAAAGERAARSLLDARPRRVEQPDHREPVEHRLPAQPRDLLLADHPHRSGHHREVVRGAVHAAAVDQPLAGDHAIRGVQVRLGVPHPSSSADGRAGRTRRTCPRRTGGRSARARSACGVPCCCAMRSAPPIASERARSFPKRSRELVEPGVSRGSVTGRPSRCSSRSDRQAATPMIRPSIQPVQPLEQIPAPRHRGPRQPGSAARAPGSRPRVRMDPVHSRPEVPAAEPNGSATHWPAGAGWGPGPARAEPAPVVPARAAPGRAAAPAAGCMPVAVWAGRRQAAARGTS